MSYDVIDGKYFTGNLIPASTATTFAVYEDSQPMLTLDEIEKIVAADNRTPARKRFPADKWIRNQGGRGSCNGYAGAWALARARVMCGLPFEALSGEYLYSMINGGRDGGSMLDDGMKAITERGVAREELVRHESYLWNQMSEQARQDAPRFKAFECYTPKTELGLASGICLGWIGVVATHYTNAMMRLNNGVSAESLGPGNHAECCQDVYILSGREIGFDLANSHGIGVLDKGHHIVTWKKHLSSTSRNHVFYLIRGVTDDPQNPAPEPK